ncbi:hypothetical protein TNCV_3012701 [Trichonephila clavipes]|nr:hypothetical protein TNCV_3012701 [Trichonephila clavipes]
MIAFRPKWINASTIFPMAATSLEGSLPLFESQQIKCALALQQGRFSMLQYSNPQLDSAGHEFVISVTQIPWPAEPLVQA